MNLYNIEQFKCNKCQQWFHPTNKQPYFLPCQHSICSKCLNFALNRKDTKLHIYCPAHQTLQPIDKIVINAHVQEALQRLVKSTKENENGNKKRGANISSMQSQLYNMVQEKYQDMVAFRDLLERIYTNEINRIMHLRARVKNQITGHYQAYEQWKSLIEMPKNNVNDLMEEGKAVEKKIGQFNILQLQTMAQRVIQESTIALQRNFSIHDLMQCNRSVLKPSSKLNHARMQSSLSSQLGFKNSNKKNQKYMNFMVNTVQSPQKQAPSQLSNGVCKQLSSFKLDSALDKSLSPKQDKVIDQFKLSTSILANDIPEHSTTTVRQIEQSNCSFKTKPYDRRERDRQQKRSHFAQLISSLHSDDQLAYSPQISQEMLLSQTKQQINFLQDCGIERKQPKNEIEIKKRKLIDCEKESSKYVRKMEEVRTDQAYGSTQVVGNTLQLFNFDLKEIDLKAFLDKFDWNQLQTIKLVGTGLQDLQFNQLLNYMVRTKIHSLILPNNQLQQISLDALLNFTDLNSHLKSVSLQRNNISTLHGNARSKIAMLRHKGITLYI